MLAGWAGHDGRASPGPGAAGAGPTRGGCCLMLLELESAIVIENVYV
jgi:hypothetical protein